MEGKPFLSTRTRNRFIACWMGMFAFGTPMPASRGLLPLPREIYSRRSLRVCATCGTKGFPSFPARRASFARKHFSRRLPSEPCRCVWDPPGRDRSGSRLFSLLSMGLAKSRLSLPRKFRWYSELYHALGILIASGRMFLFLA